MHKWFNDEDHGHWLLILDNADDTELFFPKPVLDSPLKENIFPSGLASYLPRSSKGSILITTRNKILGKDLANGNMPIEIEHFTPGDAEILLRSKVPQDLWDETDASKLVEALGCLPLAITQCAAYVSNFNVSLEEYLAEVENDDLNLKEYLSEELQDPRRELGSPNSVFRTWILSFKQIRRQHPKAAQILSLMAVLDRQGVPKSLLRKENDRSIDFTTALGILQAFCLIKAEVGGDTFTMHRLVQLSTQNWLEMEGTHVAYKEEALQMLSAKFPSGDYETWKICEVLLPHAQIVLKYSCTADFRRLDRACLLYGVAGYNLKQGRTDIAHIYAVECYEVFQMLLDSDQFKILDSISLIGQVHMAKGNAEAAETVIRQALRKYESVLGREHRAVLGFQNLLADSLVVQGKCEQATKIFLQVYQERERRLGMEHLDTLSSVQDLGVLFGVQGNFDAAEEWLRRALKGYEEILGELHPRTLAAACSLAEILENHPKFLDEAYSLYQRTCAGFEYACGPDHPWTLRVSNAYSTMLDKMRKDDSSRKEPHQPDEQSDRKVF